MKCNAGQKSKNGNWKSRKTYMLDDAQRFPDDLKTFIVLSRLSYTI